jgi:hypothetical protein
MLSPLPRRSGWAYPLLCSPRRISLPRKGCRVGLRIVLFEDCSAFTRVTACTLALSPIRDTLIEGFSHFVTSMTAPIASGWSGCRVGFAPTGKRRLVTAHTQLGHRSVWFLNGLFVRHPGQYEGLLDGAWDGVVFFRAAFRDGTCRRLRSRRMAARNAVGRHRTLNKTDSPFVPVSPSIGRARGHASSLTARECCSWLEKLIPNQATRRRAMEF